MTRPILPTKLFIPQSPGEAVTRQRLFDRLDAGLKGVLTLVSAPAGYGKSTLLADWAKQTKIPVAWLSLDSNDHDPQRFWSHFIAALETHSFLKGVKIRELLSAEPSLLPLEIDEFLDELIKEIVDIPENFVLILDDFHEISGSNISDEVLYLCENLSASLTNFHLILSTRSDPPWPLARLRVSNQVIELRAKDLRFTAEETAQLFNKVMALGLTPNEISMLKERAEGWAAGLQMAAISLRGRKDKQKFITSFSGSHRFVMDYLLEEVLDRQPENLQDFLLKTSILERLNGDLCDFIMSESKTSNQQIKEISQSVLTNLEKNNLFLVALDDRRYWFRYHHLFSDLLQNRLNAKNPEIIPELHRRASIWFSKRGYLEECVEHALNTNDLESAAQQIEANVLDLIQHGNVIVVRKWIRSLPNEIIRPSPILCLAQAWAYTNYATIEIAEELLAQAEATILDDSSQQDGLDQEMLRVLSSQISILRVVIARVRGDPPQQQRELALDALDQLGPSDNIEAQANLTYRIGLCYLDLGNLEQANQILLKAVKLGHSSENHYVVHAANYVRMVIAKLKGNLFEIAAICQSNLNKVSKNDQQKNLAGIDLIMLGRVHYEWNHLDQARHNLSTGLALVEHVGITELLIKGQYSEACLKIAFGETPSIPDLIGITERSHPRLTAYAAALQVRIGLLLASKFVDSNLANFCYQWAETQQLTIRDPFSYDWEIQEKLVYARVLCHHLQTHSGTEIEEKLEAFLNFYSKQRFKLEELSWDGTLIEGDIVIALILQTLGRYQDALISLERALRLAESHKFIRIFIDEGQPMRGLLQQASTKRICMPYTQKLLSAFDRSEELPQSEMDLRSTDLVEPLSEREFEVLRLLNTHLSVPAIAAEIHLAPTTVRSHVQNIYHKLNTHSRIETLKRAKELGLL